MEIKKKQTISALGVAFQIKQGDRRENPFKAGTRPGIIVYRPEGKR